MKRKILLSLICGSMVLAATGQKKQKSAAFALTGPEKGHPSWTEVRLVDLVTGEELQTIYKKNQEIEILNARTGKPVEKKEAAAVTVNRIAAPVAVSGTTTITSNGQMQVIERDGQRVIVKRVAAAVSTYQPFSTKSAACAYDSKHERLYYTPMGINQLRFIDLKGKTASVHYFENEAFGTVSGPSDISNQITRMVIASDGNGYALTNDANHLIRFTTNKKAEITDLGALTDESGNAISVHQPGGYGGDMIADTKKNLYLITANRNVFRISIENKVAAFLGAIKGLPRGYSTNGAAVLEGSTVIVGSANSTEGYYKFDLQTLQGEKLQHNGAVFNASDLANGNLASLKKKKEEKEETVEPKPVPVEEAVVQQKTKQSEAVQRNNIGVFPNPVAAGQAIKISFSDQPQDRYQLQLTDISGKLVSRQTISINSKVQVAEFIIPEGLAKGSYLIRISGENSLVDVVHKLLVQ